MAALGAPAPPSGRGVDALLLSRKRRRVLSLLSTVDGGAPDIVAPAVEGAIPQEIIELYHIRTHIHGATPAEVAAMLRPVVDIILYVVLFYARCREMREHASWRRQGIRVDSLRPTLDSSTHALQRAACCTHRRQAATRHHVRQKQRAAVEALLIVDGLLLGGLALGLLLLGLLLLELLPL